MLVIAGDACAFVLGVRFNGGGWSTVEVGLFHEEKQNDEADAIEDGTPVLNMVSVSLALLTR